MPRSPTEKKEPSLIAWSVQRASSSREYVETIVVISAVTALGWFLAPRTSHLAFGLFYLLAVIVLSLRVGRWPVLLAGILSAMAWDFLLIPPYFSFAVMSVEDGMMLGTYCVVALVAGQLTARVRAQELVERLREQRATALFHLTRALAATGTLDEAATAFLRQADGVFNAKTALLFTGENGSLSAHRSSSYSLAEHHREFSDAKWAFPKDIVDRFDTVAQLLSPNDLVELSLPLFSHRYASVGPRDMPWEEREKLLSQRRREALTAIAKSTGFGGILALLEKAENAWAIGWELAKVEDKQFDARVVPELLVVAETTERKFAEAYATARIYEDVVAARKMSFDKWSPEEVSAFVALLPFGRETWDQVATLPEPIPSEYWKKRSIFRP